MTTVLKKSLVTISLKFTFKNFSCVPITSKLTYASAQFELVGLFGDLKS